MDDRIRTSDADRERVTARLREHYAEGRLSREELDERISGALNATTFGDLRRVMTDLPEPGLAANPFARQPLARQPGTRQPGAPISARQRRHPVAFRRRPRLLPLLLLIALLVLVALPGAGAAVIVLKVFAVIAAVMVAMFAVAAFFAARFIRRMRRNWYLSGYQQLQDHLRQHGWPQASSWSWPGAR